MVLFWCGIFLSIESTESRLLGWSLRKLAALCIDTRLMLARASGPIGCPCSWAREKNACGKETITCEGWPSTPLLTCIFAC